MDYKAIIEELEREFISEKKSVFKKRIDTEKCLTLIIRLKNEYPSQMAEADRIMENRQGLLNEARLKSDLIIENAKKEADKIEQEAKANCDEMFLIAQAQAGQLVSSSAITAQAQAAADSVFMQAAAESDKLATRAYNLLAEVFAKAVDELYKATKMAEDSGNLILGAFSDKSEQKR